MLPDDRRVLVQGVNMVKRHTTPRPGQPGGIVEKEASIHVSNVAHVDPKDRKPTRVGFKARWTAARSASRAARAR